MERSEVCLGRIRLEARIVCHRSDLSILNIEANSFQAKERKNQASYLAVTTRHAS